MHTFMRKSISAGALHVLCIYRHWARDSMRPHQIQRLNTKTKLFISHNLVCFSFCFFFLVYFFSVRWIFASQSLDNRSDGRVVFERNDEKLVQLQLSCSWCMTMTNVINGIKTVRAFLDMNEYKMRFLRRWKCENVIFFRSPADLLSVHVSVVPFSTLSIS